MVRLLLPNRLYDCVLFKKPILVSRGTYLEDVVSKYHLGLAIDVENEDVVTAVEEYLKKFDSAQFDRGCQLFLEKVQEDIRQYENALYHFCAAGITTDVC